MRKIAGFHGGFPFLSSLAWHIFPFLWNGLPGYILKSQIKEDDTSMHKKVWDEFLNAQMKSAVIFAAAMILLVTFAVYSIAAGLAIIVIYDVALMIANVICLSHGRILSKPRFFTVPRKSARLRKRARRAAEAARRA